MPVGLGVLFSFASLCSPGAAPAGSPDGAPGRRDPGIIGPNPRETGRCFLNNQPNKPLKRKVSHIRWAFTDEF